MTRVGALLKTLIFPRGKDVRKVEPPTSWTARNLGAFRPVFAEPSLTLEERQVVDAFHDLYYSKLDGGKGLHTIVLSWMGYEMFKCPLDLWTYQELIVQRRPD